MDIGQLWRLLDNEVTRGSACVISVANLSLAAGAKVAAGGGGHDGEGRPFNSGPEPLPPKKRSALGHLLLLSLNLSFHKWDAGKRRGPGGGEWMHVHSFMSRYTLPSSLEAARSPTRTKQNKKGTQGSGFKERLGGAITPAQRRSAFGMKDIGFCRGLE